MELGDTHLSLLTWLCGDHGTPLVMDLQHELRRCCCVISKELLEDEDDIGHQGDGIVPHDDIPAVFERRATLGNS